MGLIRGLGLFEICLERNFNSFKRGLRFAFATSTPLTAGIPGIVMKLFRKKKFVFEVRDLWPELPKALGMRNPFGYGA